MSVDNPLGIFNNRMLHLEEQSMLFDLTKVGNDGDVDVVRGLTLEDVTRLHAAIGKVIASYSTPKTNFLQQWVAAASAFPALREQLVADARAQGYEIDFEISDSIILRADAIELPPRAEINPAMHSAKNDMFAAAYGRRPPSSE